MASVKSLISLNSDVLNCELLHAGKGPAFKSTRKGSPDTPKTSENVRKAGVHPAVTALLIAAGIGHHRIVEPEAHVGSARHTHAETDAADMLAMDLRRRGVVPPHAAPIGEYQRARARPRKYRHLSGEIGSV